ncbi:hypothetical protein Scep_025978 [Stephania cephalantha]|uniref:Uncharacterized protein n=1 Tax=Stephania cephalantha TaxID=152367 RepID=A0AAP0ET53_9MAGN
MIIMEVVMTPAFLTVQRRLIESHGNLLLLHFSFSVWDPRFYFYLSSSSLATWEAIALRLMVSCFSVFFPFFQGFMRLGSLIIHGEAQKATDLHLSLDTEVESPFHYDLQNCVVICRMNDESGLSCGSKLRVRSSA